MNPTIYFSTKAYGFTRSIKMVEKKDINLWVNPSILHSESDSKNVAQSQVSAFSLTGCESLRGHD